MDRRDDDTPLELPTWLDADDPEHEALRALLKLIELARACRPSQKFSDGEEDFTPQSLDLVEEGFARLLERLKPVVGPLELPVWLDGDNPEHAALVVLFGVLEAADTNQPNPLLQLDKLKEGFGRLLRRLELEDYEGPYVYASAACDLCGDDVRIMTDAPQEAHCEWYAYDGDQGHCVSCGALHSVCVDDGDDEDATASLSLIEGGSS